MVKMLAGLFQLLMFCIIGGFFFYLDRYLVGQTDLIRFLVLSMSTVVAIPVIIVAMLITGILAYALVYSAVLFLASFTSPRMGVYHQIWIKINHLYQSMFNAKYDANKALIQACYDFDFEKIKDALRKDADINLKDDNGLTPLMIVVNQASNDHMAKVIMKYLLLQGADPTLKNSDKKNVLLLIIERRKIQLIQVFKISNQVHDLVNEWSRNRTPLMRIIDKTNDGDISVISDMLDNLLELKPDINKYSKDDSDYDESPSPNNGAIRYARFPVIQLIKALEKHILNQTPYIEPIQKMCMKLLDKGANPNPKIQWIFNGSEEEVTINFLFTHTFPDHPLMNEVLDRCRRIRDNAAFSVPENIQKTTDQQLISNTFQEALRFQGNGSEQAIRALIDLFLTGENVVALNCMDSLLKAQMPGFAYFHFKLAKADRDAVKHCLKGRTSQEESPEAKEMVKELDLMLREKFPAEEDVMDAIAKNILDGVKAQAALFHLKQAQQAQAAQTPKSAKIGTFNPSC